MMIMNRRHFLLAAASFGLAAPAAAAPNDRAAGWYVGIIPDEPYNIGIANIRKIPPEYRRQEVRFRGPEPVGALVVDAGNRFLYQVTAPGEALRFGIAVGREGASWKGQAVVGRKAKWPGWTPTANMRRRDPKLPAHVPGGPTNPLGARALYLFQNGVDTLYRIHGTNQPWSIGKAASSGCIRMLNEDIFELYASVPNGTRVIVR